MRNQKSKYHPRRKPRFYCDENLFPACISSVPKFDIKHAVLDYGFGGREDKFHFDFAYHEQRILLTLDSDYENDLKYKLLNTFGVIIISVPPPVTPEKVTVILVKLQVIFSTIDYDSLKHEKIIATPRGIKVWHLENGKKVIEDHSW